MYLEVFRSVNWDEKRIKINGKLLNNSRLNDNVVLKSENLRNLIK